MAAQGWLGLHIPEADGGQGFGVSELAVVLEELGHALFPAPFFPRPLPQRWARYGSTDQRSRYLPGSGRRFGPGGAGARRRQAACRRPPRRTDGQRHPATRVGIGDGTALLVPRMETAAGAAGPERSAHGDATSRALPALDATRPLGRPSSTASSAPMPAWCRPGGGAPSGPGHGGRRSAGVARWCLETASDYAKVRVQFGRPIGQFQAVKHALADMLVEVEQAAAVAWDAAAAWSDTTARRRATSAP